MPIYIYNSLTRRKDPLEPLSSPPEVRMYVCGPTVYDEPHIGHARSAYIFDVIRRYLVYRGYKVKFVRNVTDVDDKIIDKARTEFPGKDLNDAVRVVSNKYLKVYHDDIGSLGILKPDFEPKATEYVSQDKPAMQRFIEGLINRGAAYVSGGDVYFDIKKAKDYGKLSNQSIEKMASGSRVAPGENKRDPLDFALWKSAREGEPSWDSPWGKGRPGWHIECSVMSSAILGEEFDIHGGGIDLIFPHHENEIAQSEGAGQKFSRIWVHNGLLTINGQKMAKSQGNFITIKDFLSKYKNADLLKLFFLSAHYSSPIDYNGQKLEETRQALERIMILLAKIDTKMPLLSRLRPYKKYPEIEEMKNKFIAAMDDDFNTPGALACIFELVNLANKNIRDKDSSRSAKDTIKQMSQVLGISLNDMPVSTEITDEQVRSRITERERARRDKDYALSDKIRKELQAKGIILEDAKDGTTWRRKI